MDCSSDGSVPGDEGIIYEGLPCFSISRSLEISAEEYEELISVKDDG